MSIRIKFSQDELRRRSATALGVDLRYILNVCATFGGKKYYVLVRDESKYPVETKASELTIWQMVDALPIQSHNVCGSTYQCCPDLVPAMIQLGLDCFPSKETLKNAYRKLCKTMHPDNGGDANDFIALKSSYELILNRLSQ